MKKLITVRIDAATYDQYRKVLEENGMDMSKRIRNFIDSEIKKYSDEKADKI
jgi:antitoxin component of RelBE/YafQ-DinJ toxin-antitoxin module